MKHKDAVDAMLTDEKWRAIVENDTSYNGQFFYAVQTTGIFCKPSCNSRLPKKENVQIYHHAADALQDRFLPCKRCKPVGGLLRGQTPSA